MAPVRIDSGPIDPRYSLNDVPEDQWRVLMQVRRDYLGVTLPRDCRCLLEFVEDAVRMYAVLGFKSETDFIRRGLELDPQQVTWAIDGLRRMQPNEPIPYERAQELGKRGAGPGRGKKKQLVIPSVSSGGMTRAYILARLDRDGFTELAAKVRAKELSADAAAKIAGIRKKQSPVDQVRQLITRLLPKLSPNDRAELKRLLDD